MNFEEETELAVTFAECDQPLSEANNVVFERSDTRIFVAVQQL